MSTPEEIAAEVAQLTAEMDQVLADQDVSSRNRRGIVIHGKLEGLAHAVLAMRRAGVAGSDELRVAIIALSRKLLDEVFVLENEPTPEPVRPTQPVTPTPDPVTPIIEVTDGVAEVTEGHAIIIDWKAIGDDMAAAESTLSSLEGIDSGRANAARDLISEIWPDLYKPTDADLADAKTCRFCERTIVNKNGVWIDPEANGDDIMWRETCDANDSFVEAHHEPSDG